MRVGGEERAWAKALGAEMNRMLDEAFAMLNGT
jgi:hypothetical protein